MEKVAFHKLLNPIQFEKEPFVPDGYEHRSRDCAYDNLLGFVMLDIFENEDYSHFYIRYTYQIETCEGCLETREDVYRLWDIESHIIYTVCNVSRNRSMREQVWEVPFNGR
ncbi:hypothetical protein [Vagococcus fluvialis]|uniref:hypothetical protein n=1 Tax=Vagococcus fluvialis TaxID=2738 RepID=UPI001D09F76A|nr:hypothetical protein [Vagococcus fluvialis]UDM72672.1 hypothetical protein K5L00_14890 [Vagococcus fluvialis]UDM78395.1 hypothetical protein K5K98_15095 [Vagococcus fluvialis]UDM83947.1 hypothetical protein K5K96_14915 [Vagococcus fluvialis]